MPQLIHQRCQNHYSREAVARCPECHGHFCRECISEHEQRVICATCLRKLNAGRSNRKLGWGWLVRSAGCILGLLVAWLFFYVLGECLIAMPDSFHQDTIWQPNQSGTK